MTFAAARRPARRPIDVPSSRKKIAIRRIVQAELLDRDVDRRQLGVAPAALDCWR